MVVCPKQNAILVLLLRISKLIPCQSITFFTLCILNYHVQYYVTSHCSLLPVFFIGPWHSDNWIINFRSNRYMLALGMLAYLKWIKWHAWLWMSRIMRYVWVRCWCQLHSHCQNGNWNIHCSVSSSAVSAVSHCLLFNCCAYNCTFIFLFNVLFSFHLFVYHLVIPFSLPSFLPFFVPFFLSLLHAQQFRYTSLIKEGMNAVLYDVLRPGYLQLPDTACTCKCRCSQLCFVWMMFNM